jgi:hypothetical protein
MRVQSGATTLLGLSTAALLASLSPSRIAVAADKGPPPDPAPAVDIDRLLRLPTSYDAGEATIRYGSSTATDWRERFSEANEALEKAQSRLAETQSQLGSMASDSSQWQMGAPGLGKPDAEHGTVSYKLRAELRTQRDDLVVAEKQHKQLAIEADLAGVPEALRHSEGQPEPEVLLPEG